MKITKNHYEYKNIFKSENDPTIEFKNLDWTTKYIYIVTNYSSKNNWKRSAKTYTISMKDSNKYHYKEKTKTWALEKVKAILNSEWFKKQKILNTDNLELEIDTGGFEKSIINKKNKEKEKINKKIQKKYKIKSLYNEIWDFLDKLNFDYIHKNNMSLKGEEEHLIESIYWKQSFCGSTDYKDHRKDTKEELLKLVEQNKNYTKSLQILHFINYNTWDFYKKIELIWKHWWWSAKFKQ